MDELDRMVVEAQKFNKRNLAKKKIEVDKRVETFEFKTLLDAVELLFELRAKREKNVKEDTMIYIIERILKEEPFEYKDEDYILSAYKDTADENLEPRKRRR